MDLWPRRRTRIYSHGNWSLYSVQKTLYSTRQGDHSVRLPKRDLSKGRKVLMTRADCCGIRSRTFCCYLSGCIDSCFSAPTFEVSYCYRSRARSVIFGFRSGPMPLHSNYCIPRNVFLSTWHHVPGSPGLSRFMELVQRYFLLRTIWVPILSLGSITASTARDSLTCWVYRKLCQQSGNSVYFSLEAPALYLRTTGSKKRQICFPAFWKMVCSLSGALHFKLTILDMPICSVAQMRCHPEWGFPSQWWATVWPIVGIPMSLLLVPRLLGFLSRRLRITTGI